MVLLPLLVPGLLMGSAGGEMVNFQVGTRTFGSLLAEWRAQRRKELRDALAEEFWLLYGLEPELAEELAEEEV